MTSRSMTVAAALVRLWTHLYTFGLPADVMTRRRAEIDSDLWEFQHDARTDRGLGTTGHVLARLVAGMPHDVAWRVEQDMVPGMLRRVAMVGATSTFLLIGVWVVPLWSGNTPHQHCVVQQQAGVSALNPSSACECEQSPSTRPPRPGRSRGYFVRVICRP